jgi:FtsH-binding integral membrane protein
MFANTQFPGIYRSASQVNTAMASVYGYMALATIVSMAVAWFVGTTPVLLQFFFTGFVKWIVIFAPLAAIFAVHYALAKDPPKSLATAMLYGFAALMGLSFAAIFAVYKMGSIVSAFMGGAILFGVMSFWGYFTKKSLDSWGSFLFAGLIAVVLASIVNIFLGNTVLSTVISAIAIIVFLGLTAYDTQKIREMVSIESSNGSTEIVGALTLYLDFINIFLSLLQLFGDKKE